MSVLKIIAGVVTAALVSNADVDPAAAIAGSKISPDFGAQNIVTTGGLTISGAFAWPSTAITPSISMATHATTPQLLTIQAANVTTGTGSALAIKSGVGSVANGSLTLYNGADPQIALTGTSATIQTNGGGAVLTVTNNGTITLSAPSSSSVTCPIVQFSDSLVQASVSVVPVYNGTTEIRFGASVTLASINQVQNASTTGTTMSIIAQKGASTFASGDLQIGGGAAAGGGGASAAGLVDFRNQALGTGGATVAGGTLLTGLFAKTLPIKIGGVAAYVLCLT